MIQTKLNNFLNNNLRKLFEEFSVIELKDFTVVIYGFNGDIERIPNCIVVKGDMERYFYVSILDWSLFGDFGYNSNDELIEDFTIFQKWLTEDESNKELLIKKWDAINRGNEYLYYIYKEHDEHVKPFNVERNTFLKINDFGETCSFGTTKLFHFVTVNEELLNTAKRRYKQYKKELWKINKKFYLKTFVFDKVLEWIRKIYYLLNSKLLFENIQRDNFNNKKGIFV